jgi:endonuclease-3
MVVVPRQNLSPSQFQIQHGRAVYALLEGFFGLPDWHNPQPALDELVSTILSQNTNDRNRDTAYQALHARFPTWEQVRDAPAEAVIEAIRPAGLANQKGPRIQHILRQITEERGSLDLEFLKDLSPQEAQNWLLRFHGVGRKTAAIVLVFSLGLPAFPVDTHVHRVSGRIGLRPPELNADECHDYLAGIFDTVTYAPAHLNLIRLGREICHARKPECERCPLNAVCEYFLSIRPEKQ